MGETKAERCKHVEARIRGGGIIFARGYGPHPPTCWYCDQERAAKAEARLRELGHPPDAESCCDACDRAMAAEQPAP